jgi:multidrug transporter EmrE-like cation transporter
MRNYNTSFASVIAYFIATLISGMYYFSQNPNVFSIENVYIIAFIGFLNTFFYFLSTLSRVESMHSVDTTIFFPLYKTFLPIIVMFISFSVFNETLTSKEFVGIVI